MRKPGSATTFTAIFLSLMLFCAARGYAQAQLGNVQFPNSGKPAAQEAFLKGLAALHSFWYEEALEYFEAAAKADPDFAMARWGAAMTYNHPLWGQQEAEPARKALALIRDTGKLTPRERAFIDAARALYGEGDKLARDQAYAAAMEKMYRDYPDDLESAAFYSLSLLGTVRPVDKGWVRQMRAGAIALEVYQKNPLHPGAAHYVIHAFDDPEHAIIALPAARRYADIAPAAHHAQHMPAHIFLQLGMWPEAARSNETAWRVSDEWVTGKKLSPGLRDYHSNHWLTYVYAQQGRHKAAEALVRRLREDRQKHGTANVRFYDDTLGLFIVETERWDLIDQLLSEPATAAAAGGEHAGHHGGAAPAPAVASTPVGAMGPQRRGVSVPQFVRAYAAAAMSAPNAGQLLGELRALRQQSGDTYGAKSLEIRELEITALLAASRRQYDEALSALKRATILEEEMAPPSGPPSLLKPSHELLGEISLRAGKPREAMAAFGTALARQPNRARSLLGLARAAAAAGDKAAATTAYAKLLSIWQQADSGLAELREARDFMGQASLR
ncbi:MAG: tetratricopeptide repeat protein [Blastocatellia bacterium]